MNLLYFSLISVFWGGSYIAIKILISDLPVVFSAFMRVSFAGLFLFVFFLLLNKNMSVHKELRWKSWLAGIFLQGLPFAILFWAQKVVSPSLSAILVATVPLWAFILSFYFLKNDEEVTLAKVLGLILCFLGVLLIFLPTLQMNSSDGLIWGVGAVVIAAFSYAVGVLITRSILKSHNKVDFFGNLFQQQLASIVFLFFVTLFFERGFPITTLLLSKKALAAVIYLSFFSTALAWLMFFKILQTWGSVKTSASTYVCPIITLILDYVIFNHILSLNEWVGSVGILMGILLIQVPKEYFKTIKIQKIIVHTLKPVFRIFQF
ncbi:MAG: DMT family transporter [Deltaproteobacteria bacterium]|nr:DMT family transporter [Deltaproteobacteria bacterium]